MFNNNFVTMCVGKSVSMDRVLAVGMLLKVGTCINTTLNVCCVSGVPLLLCVTACYKTGYKARYRVHVCNYKVILHFITSFVPNRCSTQRNKDISGAINSSCIVHHLSSQ
jgi:hypothetical protein